MKDRLSEWKTHIRTQYHKCRRLFEIFWRAQKGMFFVTFIPQIHTSLLLLCDDNFVEWAFRKEIYFHPHALSLLFVVVVKKLSFQCQGSWWMRLNIQNVMTLSHFVNFKPRKGESFVVIFRFSEFFFVFKFLHNPVGKMSLLWKRRKLNYVSKQTLLSFAPSLMLMLLPLSLMLSGDNF